MRCRTPEARTLRCFFISSNTALELSKRLEFEFAPPLPLPFFPLTPSVEQAGLKTQGELNAFASQVLGLEAYATRLQFFFLTNDLVFQIR